MAAATVDVEKQDLRWHRQPDLCTCGGGLYSWCDEAGPAGLQPVRFLLDWRWHITSNNTHLLQHLSSIVFWLLCLFSYLCHLHAIVLLFFIINYGGPCLSVSTADETTIQVSPNIIVCFYSARLPLGLGQIRARGGYIFHFCWPGGKKNNAVRCVNQLLANKFNTEA